MQRIFVSTLLCRWYPLQFRQCARPRYFVDRRASFRAISPAVMALNGLAFCGRDNGIRTPVGNCIVALACVTGTVSGDGAISLPAGVWRDRSARTGASPVWSPLISKARTSSLRSSVPRWILRQTRRLGPPCLPAVHSSSSPRLSTSRSTRALQYRPARSWSCR